MRQELQNKLFRKYPKILVKHNKPICPFDEWGIEHRDGWYQLVDDLYYAIQDYVDNNKLPQPQCLQQKEKFGFLRIYLTNTDRYINQLLDEAEEKSSMICEYCGVEENIKQNDIKSGWIKSLCPNCRKKK